MKCCHMEGDEQCTAEAEWAFRAESDAWDVEVQACSPHLAEMMSDIEVTLVWPIGLDR